MNKYLKLSIIVLLFTAVSLAGWLAAYKVGAVGYFPFVSRNADMLEIMTEGEGGIDEVEFMKLRDEYIAAKRGIHKDKPLPDPGIRQNAIADSERRRQTLAARPESAQTEALLASWTPIGPAPIPNGSGTIDIFGQTSPIPVSGRTIAVAIHPTNPNIVYVGTALGGLYRTTDGGANWTPLLDNALSLAIGAVAIAPSQPDTVYVGTGEPNSSADSFFGVGIYRIDNASGANPLVSPVLNKNALNEDVFTGAAVSKIVVHPTDPNIIFASTTGGFGGIGTTGNTGKNRGLYRSINAAGAAPTFALIPITNTTYSVQDLVIEPDNANRLLASVKTDIDSNGGLFLTTNALAPTPIFNRVLPLDTTGRTELTINKVGGTTTIYAASGLDGGTVHRSNDAGATWTQRVDNNFCTPICNYAVAVAVDPTDAEKVYLAGSPSCALCSPSRGMAFGFSTNGASGFTRSEVGLHVDAHTIAVAPSLPTTIYTGNDGGIWKSVDSGANWINLNNSTFSATQFIGLAVHSTDPNFTIGGTQDNGTNMLRPDGTWTQISGGGDGGNALIDQTDTGTATVDNFFTYNNLTTFQGYEYSSTAGDGYVHRGCQSFGSTGNGITCTGPTLFYPPLEQGPAVAGSNGNTIYFGSQRLYRSTDAGATHTVVSQDPIVNFNAISAIGISPQNDNVRIVGFANGAIFGTTTGATTLTDLDPSNDIPDSLYVARTVVSPTNQNKAYVTLAEFGVTNVWKTTTLGSSAIENNPDRAATHWTAASGNGAAALPPVPVNAFVVDPLNSTNLYAGTDVGVYVSTDDGATWNPLGTGLPRVAVFDMAITANRQLRIATHGRGMWQISLLAPTAAGVSVSGRILTGSGRGVRNARVRLIDGNGATQTVSSRAFGNYNFAEITAGQTVTVFVEAKNYSFAPRIISITADIENLDFTAQ